jgi:transcriptional regulator with AAA-type ATPase domain/ferredoxin
MQGYPVLDADTVDHLRQFGTEVDYPLGSVILRRGEAGQSFYVILAGAVEISVKDPEGDRLKLRELGEGNFFGEISLLIQSPVTADVVASRPLKALVCSKDSFLSALADSASLGATLSRVLASRLAANTTDLWSLHQQGKALNMLMGPRRKAETMVAVSSAMSKVQSRVDSLEKEPFRAILIHGGAGTGKTFLASRIHETCMEPQVPFIVFDCRSFCSEETASVLFGASFKGGERGAGVSDETCRPVGAVDLAEGGSLVLRHVDALSLGSQEILLEFLSGIYGRTIAPFQLIATSRRDPAELQRDGLLHPGLEEMLEKFTLRLPDLRERRKDILPLADLFLKKCEGQSVFRFSQAAAKKLLSHGFRLGNVAELKEMVETAVQISDGVEIGEEHLFSNRWEERRSVEFDLGRSPLLRRALAPRSLRAVRAAVLAGFAAVIALSLFRPDHSSGQIANAVIWSAWEPLLFASFFVFGRVWCTICPISTAGKALGRLFHFQRPPPEWLKQQGSIILIFGFAAIIWSEHWFVMPENPVPSGILLLALFGAAAFFALLYRRETWCRYACPLGGLGAAYSLPGMLTVKANAHVCANYCTTYDCYKGSEKKSGCPVYRHPLHDADSHNCKLCLSCLDACPHGATKLYLRPPLMSVWHAGPLGDTILLFAFFLFFFGPAMLASKGTTWAATHAGFGFTTILALLLAMVFRRSAPKLLSESAESGGLLLSRVAISLLVLAWGPLMAYQMQGITVLSSFVLHAKEGAEIAAAMGEISLLFLVQSFFIIVAGVLATFTMWRVRHEVSPAFDRARGLAWPFFALCFAGYVCLNIFIATQAG